MGATRTAFSYERRVLACANCAAPLQSPASGSNVTCSYCKTPNQLAPRNDSRDRQLAQAAPTMSEAQRIEKLRAQDGKPLLPPPALEHLVHNGQQTAQTAPIAQTEWQRARQDLAQQWSFASEERLGS